MDPGQLDWFIPGGSPIETFCVSLLAHVQRRRYKYFEEASVADDLPGMETTCSGGRYQGDDGVLILMIQEPGHLSHPPHILGSVVLAKTKVARQTPTDIVSINDQRRLIEALEIITPVRGKRRFPGAGQTGKPPGESQ